MDNNNLLFTAAVFRFQFWSWRFRFHQFLKRNRLWTAETIGIYLIVVYNFHIFKSNGNEGHRISSSERFGFDTHLAQVIFISRRSEPMKHANPTPFGSGANIATRHGSTKRTTIPIMRSIVLVFQGYNK